MASKHLPFLGTRFVFPNVTTAGTTAIERMPTRGRSSAESWGSSRQKHRLNSLNSLNCLN